MTTADDKGTLQTVGEKIKGKAEEAVAVVTGDPVLRGKAERDQIDSDAPDLSATIIAKARRLLGRDGR